MHYLCTKAKYLL